MEELILEAKKGNIEAFTLAILNIKNDLYKIAKVKTSNEEDIQDIIQETMLNAYKNIKKLKDPSKFKSWIIKILINNCNKYYKKKKILYNIDDYNIETYRDILKYNHDKALVEDTLTFYEIIQELKYDERIIIVLYYGERYTTKEISQILCINENTIKTRLARAKEKIKKNYKGDIYE